MLILKFNTLSADDLFAIERCLLRWLDDKARPNIDPDFNVLDYGRTELYGHLLGVFAKLGVLSALDITPSTLLDFFIDVDTTYLNAPYHSFYHAVDIVTVLYYILTELEADQYLSNLDIAALLIAALCHDAGHPGYNNLYQVNVKTDLAARYNNTSVLEAYSATITRDLLFKHKLLKDLATTNGKYTSHHHHYTWSEGRFLDAIESLILATDMVYHFELQEQAGVLEELLSQDDDDDDDSDWCSTSDSDSFAIPTPSSSTYDEEDLCYLLNRDQRQSLCRILLHAADISNTVRPWTISKQWSDLIVQEFFRQGDAEKEAGLDVSPGMDRDQSTQPDISLKFGDFLVKPYFEALAGFLPSASIFLDTLNENRSEWVRLKTCPEAAIPPENPNNERQFPSSLLPPQPILNPSGRRISVAAGTVVIPDRQIFVTRKRQRSTMSINTRSAGGGAPNNLLQRRPAGLRSASHTGVPRIIVPDRRPSDLLQQQAWLSPTLLKTTVLESPVSMCHPQDRSPLSRVSKRLA